MKTLFKLMSTIYLLIIAAALISNFVVADGKYTRENSEELFDMINWQDYKTETFEKAITEQKPIFLVISAPSWCYWCHVYESKDYLYHENLYTYINENFIPIFVDSDKRPDLTRKYLEGGWPSTTLLTPNMIRINGYVGPRDPIMLRDYFEQVVNYVKSKSFDEVQTGIEYKPTEAVIPKDLNLPSEKYLTYVDRVYDKNYGGFLPGQIQGWREGQKFPRGLTLKFLLEKYDKTKDEKYLNMVLKTFNGQFSKSLDEYRLFDPVEGGFHRYGTNTDWTIPHYEKMLGDQAKLIRVYGHLATIDSNENVRNVVDKSLNFVFTKFSDPTGGFYSSQDAYLEDKYYGKDQEGRNSITSPYIDRTRRADANAMMISTLLYLYRIEKKEEYKSYAKKSLDFFRDFMISDDGVAYYFDEKGVLTGQSLSNSWVLLSFVEGYETLSDESYFDTSVKIADYSLAQLYDLRSGGFFERHSTDKDLYSLNEGIDLSKPFEENAVFSYAMLKLYLLTKNLDYLESGIKTVGFLSDKEGGLDEMYYFLKANQLIKEENLLDEYYKNKDKIDESIKERTFFVDNLPKPKSVDLSDAPKLKDEFSSVGFFILIILAFSGGLLSFFSPCTFPVLSAYFSHNLNSKKGVVLKNSIGFFLGLALMFSLFGMGATIIGSFIRAQRGLLTKVAGAIIIVLGGLEIFGKGFSGLKFNYRSKKNFFSSFMFGCVFAVGWTACIGPILASLLLLAASMDTVFKGMSLLFIYALGLGLPLIILSYYFDRIKNEKFWKILQGKLIEFKIFKTKFVIHTTYILSGVVLIILGILIFNDYLYSLNQYALQMDFVQEILFKGEEWLRRVLVGD